MLEFNLLDHSAEAATGTFSGYLAADGNTDENEDRLMPGAFTASLAEYRRAGEMPPMFLNHAGIPWDAVTTESLLPIGVWADITEDSRGLSAKGRIDPMDTDFGKRIYAGLANRTVNGLSIGYKAIGFTAARQHRSHDAPSPSPSCSRGPSCGCPPIRSQASTA